METVEEYLKRTKLRPTELARLVGESRGVIWWRTQANWIVVDTPQGPVMAPPQRKKEANDEG